MTDRGVDHAEGAGGSRPDGPAATLHRLGRRLTLPHHDQGVVIVLALGALVAVARSAGAATAGAGVGGLLVFVVALQLPYGGAGTFQRPARAERSPGPVDVVLVTLGLAGLGVFAASLALGLLAWLS